MSPEDFPDRRRLAAFEGGAVYRAEAGGKYYIVLDEGTMTDLLSEEDLVGLREDLVKILEFDSYDESEAYVLSRGWGEAGGLVDLGRAGGNLLNLKHPRRGVFLTAVRKIDPRNAAASEAILEKLLTWSSAQPDLEVFERDNEKDVFQVGLSASGRIIWAARSFKTTGTFITLLGWGSGLLENGFEEAIIKRLNSIRTRGTIRLGGELRIGVSDLQQPGALERFMLILEDTLTHSRALPK